MQRVDFQHRTALYSVEQTRHIERALAQRLPPHCLMQRAGLAVAKLALAIAPHSRHIWIACGPGNNGGDGLEAAMHLQHWGKSPVVTWLGRADTSPTDARQSFQRAMQAGVSFSQTPPPTYDLCIDALLGIGTSSRAPEGLMADWINAMHISSAPVLAVDLPTGLHADTGSTMLPTVTATHTLSLLTLKPGLFTAHGRDTAGTVWLDELASPDEMAGDAQGANLNDLPATAWLSGSPVGHGRAYAPHDSHKGSFGDVAVVGGAPGMTGAALLAASAALHAGAGRVYLALLDDNGMSIDYSQPELMFRDLATLDFSTLTVVCGCGGGDAVRAPLARVLSTSKRLVLDADALNAVATDSQLQSLLSARARRQAITVLTPHPLEASRLLGVSTYEVQNDRLAAATHLVERFDCTVVLKGSGTVVAAPEELPVINPTGNAKLATAGTGDVLAGMIGTELAAGYPPFDAACVAVYRHGYCADQWSKPESLTAKRLVDML